MNKYIYICLYNYIPQINLRFYYQLFPIHLVFHNLTRIPQIHVMYLPGTGDVIENKTFDLHLLKIFCGEFLEQSAPPTKNETVGNRSDKL